MKYRNLIIPIKFSASVATALTAACVLLCGTAARTQASPVIANTYPNGAYQFQSTNSLAFNVNSSVAVTNVTVLLNVTPLGGGTFIKTITTANGLIITGPATGLSVTAPLSTNTVYIATITATDANGNSSVSTVNFDTISPSYTFEAEDWDYNGGQFIDNPQTNAYAGLGSTSSDSSNNNGGNSYRPVNPGLSTEPNGDTPRAPWIGSGLTDFDVGFTDGGDFGNYTRHYPAGTYNLYARASGGNGVRTESADISVVAGTASITSAGSSPYKYGVQGRGWQSYDFMPVTDNAGNLIKITFDGSPSTLHVLQNQGSDNMNFFMLVPTNASAAVAATVITNLYPDGAVQFQSSATLSFTASTPNGLTTNGIEILLTGTNLVGTGTVKDLTAGNGLNVTSLSPTSCNVSAPLASNTTYTAFIQITDGDGIVQSWNVKFDTINPSYTFEAEDFDYGSGQFFNNPQVWAYFGLGATEDVDSHNDTFTSGSYDYRPPGEGLENEPSGDIPRAEYTNATAIANGYYDLDIGFNDGGNWANYTRQYPAGVYNIFLRAANGTGGGGGASLSLVTSGLGTTNQTTTNLGSFAIPATPSWSTYVFVPLKDASGNLVTVPFNGTSNATLRYTVVGGLNAGFYLLMPADTTLPKATGLYPDGSTLFQATNTLSFTASSSDGIATSAIIVTLNGVVVNNLTFAGSSTSWHVSYPHLQPNTSYTASISIKSLAGASYSQNFTFDTFAASNYQWEAEDWDYASNGVSGLFFDNPQVNAYLGLASTWGTDVEDNNSGTSQFSYRPNDGVNYYPTTVPAGDQPRAQFTTGTTDYKVDYFGNACWANYTRHYPAGTYYVYGRFTEGAGNTEATLSTVTGGYGTPTQTTSLLGTFLIPEVGWTVWEYVPLTDINTNLVTVTFDGSKKTLQFGGTPVAANDPTINYGFFFLVPVPTAPVTLTASVSGGNINISFPTKTGSSYQLLYKSHLNDVSWTTLGSPISGNNAVQSVSDVVGGSSRFYRVQVQ
jgi:hypothetical protein